MKSSFATAKEKVFFEKEKSEICQHVNHQN